MVNGFMIVLNLGLTSIEVQQTFRDCFHGLKPSCELVLMLHEVITLWLRAYRTAAATILSSKVHCTIMQVHI